MGLFEDADDRLPGTGVVGQAHARGVDPIRLANHVHRHEVFVEYLERLPFAGPSPQVPLSAVVHESEYTDRVQGRIRNQPGHVHARILEVLHDETPVLVISHGAHERYIQTKLCQRHGRVRRGSSSLDADLRIFDLRALLVEKTRVWHDDIHVGIADDNDLRHLWPP